MVKAVFGAKEIIGLVEKAFSREGLKKAAIYKIVKRVKEGRDTEDRRGKGRINPVWNEDFIQVIKEDVDRDRQVNAETQDTMSPPRQPSEGRSWTHQKVSQMGPLAPDGGAEG